MSTRCRILVITGRTWLSRSREASILTGPALSMTAISDRRPFPGDRTTASRRSNLGPGATDLAPLTVRLRGTALGPRLRPRLPVICSPIGFDPGRLKNVIRGPGRGYVVRAREPKSGMPRD